MLIRPGVLTVPNTTSFATGNPIAAIVLVKEAKGVTLTNLTVDGADNVLGGCGPNLVGIFYRNASGKVEADAVRNIRLGPASANLGGCQSGIGIFAQSGTGPGSPSKLTVIGSTVHDYQKTGIVGNEAGTELTANGKAAPAMARRLLSRRTASRLASVRRARFRSTRLSIRCGPSALT